MGQGLGPFVSPSLDWDCVLVGIGFLCAMELEFHHTQNSVPSSFVAWVCALFPSGYPQSPCLCLSFLGSPPFLIKLFIFGSSSILSSSVLYVIPTLGACLVLFVLSRSSLFGLVGRHLIPNPCSTSSFKGPCVPFTFAPRSSILIGTTSIPNSCFWFS